LGPRADVTWREGKGLEAKKKKRETVGETSENGSMQSGKGITGKCAVGKLMSRQTEMPHVETYCGGRRIEDGDQVADSETFLFQ
jgi:hypothetical protein